MLHSQAFPQLVILLRTGNIYKGVCKDERTGKYFAYINCDKQRTYLGTFDNKHLAAQAYDEAAVRLHGDFACLNFERQALAV